MILEPLAFSVRTSSTFFDFLWTMTSSNSSLSWVESMKNLFSIQPKDFSRNSPSISSISCPTLRITWTFLFQQGQKRDQTQTFWSIQVLSLSVKLETTYLRIQNKEETPSSVNFSIYSTLILYLFLSKDLRLLQFLKIWISWHTNRFRTIEESYLTSNRFRRIINKISRNGIGMSLLTFYPFQMLKKKVAAPTLPIATRNLSCSNTY